MKRILVTGGAGFIGSHFARHLVGEKGLFVRVLDKLTYAGNTANLEDLDGNPNFEFMKGDIASAEDVGRAMEGMDTIVNFAAETHVDRSITDPGAFVRTDIIGTYTLLEAARERGGIRYLQVSTDEVYGSTIEGTFSETDPLSPSSPYSASKAGADLIVLSYIRTYGLDAVLTRSTNNYGPNQYPEKLVPLIITNLIEGKKIPIYGDGKNRRDWIHVRDNCSAIALVAERGEKGGIYNIGAGEERENLEIAERILGIMGLTSEMIEFVKDRPGHDRRYAVSTERIRSLGWEPGISFDDGIAGTVEWYGKNEAWWKKIKSGEYREYYRRMYGRR